MKNDIREIIDLSHIDDADDKNDSKRNDEVHEVI